MEDTWGGGTAQAGVPGTGIGGHTVFQAAPLGRLEHPWVF